MIDIVSNLQKYNITDVSLSLTKANDENEFGYNVIIRGISNSIKTKQIYEYIEYMESHALCIFGNETSLLFSSSLSTIITPNK